ncbi:MAG TPA: hypothetical protein VHT52_13895 [Stellaceae bacterium]|nr:hypothetical protein [Stellaceae bacterium]
MQEAPDGPEWLHEIKFDGYRMHARLDRGIVRLLTRTGLDWTHKYPALDRVAELQNLNAGERRRQRAIRHQAAAWRRNASRLPAWINSPGS